MRHHARLGLATLGLALSASPMALGQAPAPASTTASASSPAAAVVADAPAPSDAPIQPATGAGRRWGRRNAEVARVPLGVLTDAQAAEVRRQGGPSTVVGPMASEMPVGITKGCAACEAASKGIPMMAGSLPAGVAMMPGDSSASAPGFAVVGGPVPAAEPAPVGVMRTSFGARGPVPPPAAGPGYASVGGESPFGAIGPNGQAIPRPVNPVLNSPSGRPHVLAHMLGFSGRMPTRSLREYREAKSKSQHAAISYNGDSAVSELPASMVYGR